MAIVSYKREDIPPMTPEREAELKAFAETDSDIDYSEIPKLDALDFKYTIPSKIFLALNNKERSELGRKLNAAKEAERAALKAQQEARQAGEQAIAEARQLAHQT